MSKVNNELGKVHHAVNPSYAQQLEKMNTEQVCVFCNKERMKSQPIHDWNQWEHWFVKHNDYPYPHQKCHLVIVAKQHIEKFEDLTPEIFGELQSVIQWATEKFQLPGALFVFRYGSFDYSGATIAHLHGHIQVPDRTGPVVATAFLPEHLLSRLKAKESIFVPEPLP